MVGQRQRQSARRAVSSLVKRALMSNMTILHIRRSGIRRFVHGPCMSFMRNKKCVKQIFYDNFCKINSTSSVRAVLRSDQSDYDQTWFVLYFFTTIIKTDVTELRPMWLF